MKKSTLTVASILAVCVITGGVYASSSSGLCNYTADGNFVNSNGSISAFGTMNAAMDCAAQGALPAVVARRLGHLGTADIKEWAEDIKNLDEEQKKRIEEQREQEEAVPSTAI